MAISLSTVIVRRCAALLATGLALATTLSTTLAACSDSSSSASTAAPTSTAAAPSAPPSPTPTPTTSTTPAPTAAQIRAGITSTLRSIMKRQPHDAVSVAALNTTTGERFVAGSTSGMFTASAYKLLCVSALLIHRSPSSLSGAEVSSAEAAIEHSDNAAGYQLFLDIGGRSGLTSAIRTFGMTHTVAGESDPTFTKTSGADYLKLLAALTGQVKGDPLNAKARRYILDLMGQVESDQRWGVGSAADKGTSFYNKNGWLSIGDDNGPGEDDDGLWAVTSAGVVTVKGQRVLMAVFTRYQPDFRTGVTLVNRLAKLIAPAVAR